MPLIDFTPPTTSWSDYLASLPPGRTPNAQDMFDRWDAPRYVCPNRPRNGTPAQFAAHDKESPSPGHCKCGTPFRKEGLRGIGERRAYLAYMGGLMDKDESQYFWAAVASANPDKLMEFGVLPVVKAMAQWLTQFEPGEAPDAQ